MRRRLIPTAALIGALAVLLDAQGTQQTILTTQTPSVSAATGTFELGTRFRVGVPGTILAVRYWKQAGETAMRVGRIFNAAGVLLSSVPFTGESASGWQQQALTTPVAVMSGLTYTVSVNSAVNARFPVTPQGFTTELIHGDLTAASGAYSVGGGAFPNWPSPHNYFRDVVFVSDPVPTVVVTPDTTGVGGYTVTTSGLAPGRYTLGVSLGAGGLTTSGNLVIDIAGTDGAVK